MRNFTFKDLNLLRSFFIVFLLLLSNTSLFAQICGTPGGDGPVTVSSSVNTYYPITGNVTMNAGSKSIVLSKVPATDAHLNNFGATPISTGDLILIIQMQDATIDYTNSTSYGSGTANSGLDGLGGTGFTALGNTGVFEYVIATNSVPLTGGNLTFKGTGTGGGVLNSFFNADATSTSGKRTFQIVRVPQYSNLNLTSNITTPPFNGVAGGVIAFNVSGTFNFAGYTIDGTARGFRGGYSPRADSDLNDANTYVGLSTNNKISGKGEGIAGTPRYMWDGYNQVDNLVEGMPGGSSGRGAPANAGGGGNDHNTGGGGGGNGGYGGLGGAGWQGGNGNILPATGGGRPGFRSYLTAVPFPRLVMGGGGGAGDANNASSGVKGGVGGAIILVNAGTVLGTGNIYANGGKGAPGAYSGSPDGAGGGGAGGTVLLNISNDSNATIRIEANGGDGGNTENDNNNEHGPGGGGGGGIISHNLSGTVSITASVLGGAAGKSNAGNGINHGAISGSVGYVSTFTLQDVPPNLQVNSNCFPILETKVKTLSTTSICNSIDEKVSYEVQIKNTGVGNAAGVFLDFLFPAGIEFDSATATYSLDASGPSGPLANSATANNPLFGGFNIAQNGIVTITLVGKVATSITAGTYSSNAQALYLDPTRTTADPNRKITPFTNAYGTVSKNYEGLNQSNVPGTNFIGTSSTADDITILALPTAPTVTILQSSCATPTGTVTIPVNGPGISYTLTGTSPITASITNGTGLFSGLVPGTYKVTTTNAQGCTSSPTTGIVINAVAGAPTTTGISICQDGTGSLTVSSSCLISESTGAKIAVAGASATAGTNTLSWVNPEKITSNDSSNATVAVSSGGSFITHYLQGTNFGFTIPTNATIKGIQVSISRFSSVDSNNNNVKDNVVSLIKAGFIMGANRKVTNSNWSTSSTTVIDYGGTSDLWSGSWSPSDINSPDFGIVLSANINRGNGNGNGTVTASVDYMQITVNYTVGEIEWYTTSSGGTPIYTGSSFNPVGVTGSGLINTNTPGTKTYYAACTSGSSCRAATNFVINAKPTITGTTPASRCDTGTVTLEATASSGTINWYAASTGGLSLGTGASFTTPSLSTTTSYYVDATENGCTTAARTAVVATVNTLPTINSTTESSRCGTGTVTLNATASIGATINWYAASTGGTSLGTGTNFTTPSLSGTTTYYVGATSAEGCPTASRIAVAAVINNISTITFTSGTQNPAVCAATAIPNTVYTFGGSATNAVVTNLPVGLAAAVNTSAKTVTISGTPTVGGTYTITTVGHTAPCAAAKITGIVTVNTSAAPILSAITQPTCTVTTGSFTITNYDASYTYIITPSTGVSRTGSSVTAQAGNYTIKATVNSCDSANTGFAINAQPSIPATPTISTSTTTTFCSGGNVVLTSSAGSGNQWYKDGTLISGATATTYSATASGVYSVITNNGACSSVASAGTAVTVNQIPAVPTLSAVTQPTCATATGSFTIDNYNAAYTYTITPSTGVTQTNGTVTAPEGSYTIKATLGACSSSDSVAAVVNAQPSTPAVPTLSAVTQPTCTTATGSFTIDNYNAAYTYTITPSTGVTQTNGAVTAPEGSYTIKATANGCDSVNIGFVIDAQPSTPAVPTLSAVTQPTCATATGSFTIDNYNAAYTYTITPSTGVTQTNGAVTAPQGSYTIKATLGSCSSSDSVAAVVNAQPSTPAVPTLSAVTQPTCTTATGSFTIDNYDPTYTYTITPSTGVTQTNGAVTAPQGSYTIKATLGSCSSSDSVAAVVNAQPSTPAVPTLSAVTQPTCTTATGSFTIDNYNAAYTYTIIPSTGVTQTNGTVTAPQGSYTIKATLGACSSSDSVAAVVNAQPSTPAVPTLSAVTQPTCTTATGSFTIDNYNAAYTYTITPSTGVTQTSDAVTAPEGSYTIKATANGCDSVNIGFVIDAQPSTPAVPTLSAVTQPTCTTATGSFTIDNYNAAYTYTITPSTGVTQTNGAVTAPQGSYTIKATLGACSSADSVAAVVNAQPTTPAVPTLSAVTQPTCATPTGSFTIDNYNAAYTYTITPSTGVTQTSGAVTAPEGSYTIQAILGACSSAASVAAIVHAQPSTPVVPTVSAVTQPNCATATGSFTIDNYDTSYTYTITPSTGVTRIGNSVTAPEGSYTIQATLGACSSSDSVAVVVNAQPSTPVVPTLSAVTQPTCATPTGSFTIDNYNAAYTYTITPSTGVTQTNGAVTAPQGSYTIKATLGSCSSSDSVAAVVNAQPSTPAVPTLSAVTQPTCTTATGSFTIDNYNAAYTYTIIPSTGVTQTNGTVTAPQGSYTIKATLGACSSSDSVAAVVNAQPSTPVVPTLSAVTQPTCTTATGSFTIDNYNAAYTYTITPSTGVTQTSDAVTAPEGSYTIKATANGCDSVNIGFVIDAQPSTPAVPTLSAVTQPTCTTATGSFTIDNYNAAYTYTITPSTGVTQTNGAVTAPQGSYTIKATLGACSSADSVAAVVNAQPTTPAVPTLSAVTQPTCATPTGSFTIDNYNAAYTYTITPSTGVTQTSGAVTAPEGSYTIQAILGACSSAASVAAIVHAQPSTPVVPTVSAVTQPNCATATGSFTIDNYDTSYTYTITPSTGVTRIGNSVTAPEGSYTIQATLGACSSSDSVAVVVNAQPSTPVVPTLSAVTQPTCATPTGSFTIDNYNAAYTYTITPSTGVTRIGNSVTAPEGSYTIQATVGACSSAASVAAVVNAQPSTPAIPTLSAVTQPTCATATGSFTIDNYDSSYTYTITPSTGVTQTSGIVTAPEGSYTIKATMGSCSSAASVAAVVNAQPSTPAVPTLSAVTQPTCATATGSFTIDNYNAAYTYTINPSTGVTRIGNSVTAPEGSYTIQATLGACSSADSVAAVVNAQPSTPVVPTLSAVTQPTCATATGSFTIDNYDSSYTYTITPSTGVTRTGNSVTAPAGSYKIKSTLGACSSSDSVATVVNAQPSTPVVPTLSAVTQPTCTTATGSFTIDNYNAAYTYTITPSTGVTQTNDAVTAPEGSYTIKATLGACSSADSVAAVVNAQPSTPVVPTLSAVTQPTCTTATGSFTIDNYNAAYTYTITPSTGVTQTNDAVTAPEGSYTIKATLGACSSADSVAAVVNAQPSTPVVPTLSAVTQPTCTTATGSFTIDNYNAAYTYTITPSTGVTQTNGAVTAPQGSYTIKATLGSCSSLDSVAAVVNAQPSTPAVPTLSAVTQPTCTTATGSFTIDNYNAAYTYTITPSTGVTQTNGAVTAPEGSYTIKATANGCDSVNIGFVIDAQPSTPAVPTLSAVTQPTCTTATGSFTIDNYNAAYTYTITPSTGVTQTNGAVTAPQGSYTIKATLGACSSSDSVAAVVNAQPSTPVVPTLSAVTQPTCTTATGSFTIDNYNAAYTYTITPSTGVTQTNDAVTAPQGSYTIKATLGACSSADPVAVVVNTQPSTPAVPTLSAVTQPTCTTATGSFTIDNYNAAYTYTITPSTGVTQTNDAVTAPEGSYTIKATLGACSSADSVAAVVNAQPSTPAVPTLSAVTQPTCATATGSFTIDNYNAAYTYTITPSTGVTQTNDAVTAPEGSYTIKATLGACSSADSVAAVVNAQPSTPVVPTLSAVTQPTCTTATGSFTIDNYNAAYTYTITPSTGVTQTNGAVTAPQGSYTIKATLGACSSADSVAAVVNAQPSTPAVPTLSAVTQPTCATATGSFTIDNYNAAYTYTITPSTGVTQTNDAVTAPEGSYTIKATLGACSSADSVAAVVNAQPSTPVVPTLSAVTQPTCTTATGSFTIDNYNAAYTYTITPSTGVTQTNGAVTAPQGSYTIKATLGSCSSLDSVAAVVNAQPSTPAVPTLSAVTQPTCTTATGSFTIDNYNAAYTYTITPSTGVTQTNGAVTAPEGSYTIKATANGCDSVNIGFVIDAQPSTPAVPTLSAVTQPTCTTATGSFTIDNYNAAYTYTITPSTGVTQTNGAVTAPQGSYTIKATLGSCSSSDSVAAVVNAQPSTPAVPTLSAVTQPTCTTATGSFTIDNYNAVYTYTITPSTGVTQTNGAVTAPEGSYTIKATANGCDSVNIVFVIDAQPSTPAVPTLSAVTQPTCTTATGSFTIDNYNAAYTYTITPSTGVTQTNGAVTAPEGSYTIKATLGACSSADSVAAVVNAQPSTPAVPTLSAVTQPTCTTAIGSFTIDNYNAAYTYTITPSTGVTQTNGAVIAPQGSYTIKATLGACSSADSVTAVVNAQPSTPAVPTLSAVTQPTCATATGSFTIDNYNAAYTYTITPSTGVTQTNGAVTAPQGSYTIKATLGSCSSSDSVAAVVNAQPSTPAVPTLSAVTQPTCTTATGSFTIDNYNAAYTYTITPSTGVTQTNGAVTALEGSYTIKATANGCDSVNIGFVIDAQPSTPTVPTLSAVTQPTCTTATGTITVTVQNASDIYSFDNGQNFQASNSKSGFISGTYYVIIKNAAGCNSIAESVIINAKPNCAPTAIDDNIIAIEDTLFTSTVNLTANDTDVNLDVLTLVAGTFTTTQGGKLILAADGSYTYMPAANFHGTDTVNYTLSDGILTDIGTLTITVTPLNDAPVAVDDTNSTDEDVTLTVTVNSPNNLLANDTDVDGDILTVSQFAIGSTIYTIGSTANLIEGSLTINANGSYVFVPKPDYNGSVPKVIYTITDGTNSATGNLFITVNPVNELLIINDDTATSIVGLNHATTVLNVLGNDTKGGLPIVISEVTITETVVDPTGFIKLNSDGTIILKANAPAGTYILTYQVCELNTTNCATATATITVIAPVIDAVKEITAPINGTIGGTTTSLVSNDTLNGGPVVIGTNPGQVSLSPVSVPTGLTLNADGSIKIDAGTPAGAYNVEYKICEVNNPTNCDSVISEIVVTAGVLQANTDIIGSVVGINQPTTLVNVFTNDTNNGLPIVASDMILSVITEDPTGFITLNSDGTAILGANAPAGTYELIYQICEKLNPTNCSSASIKVTVTAPTMTVTANSYCSNDVPYVSYTVAADNFTPNSLLTINWIDSANNVVATQTNLPLTGNVLWPGAIVDNNGIGIDWPGWLLTNGQWVEGADGFENTRAGVTMQFSLNPTVNVAVNYPPATAQCNARPTFAIKANNDIAGPIDSDKGQSATIDIFDNDTLNGSVVNPANVVLSTVVANPNLNLKADGSIEIKPGTPTGNYQLTYQICDALNVSNCSQAIVTVSVVNVTDPDPTPVKQIVATNDTATNVDGINGELEFINVLDNDLLNGIKINPNDIVISNIPQSPYFEFNLDGSVNVKPNTPGGNYTLIYRICEKADLSNCITAALNVFVEVPAIAIIKIAIFNDENGNGVANAGETISYKFKVTNTGNVPLVGITITDALAGITLSGQAINLALNESDETNFSAQYKITQDDINHGSVSNQATVKGQSGRGVIVEDKSDDSNNLEDKPTVLPLNGCQIKVSNAFSPNGDSKNSRFYIQGLECYPDNTVEIYNRWGVLVYDIDHYNNEDRAFIGISAGRATIKETDGLPVGTYFYILKYKDSESKPHELSGYLYINK